MKARISVIVCTFNRCQSLVDTLTSIGAMDVPPDVEWELLVVDNNSADATRACVERFAAEGRVPVRYLLERQQGLSHARNLGVRSSDKDYIAFTDDDVLVHRDWLKTIVETFQEYRAECVGGKVLPHWLEPRPAWMADSLLNVLAMLDHGDTLFEFDREDDRRILYGANFAFARDALLRAGLFNVELGRRGDFGVGEDREMFAKLRAMHSRIIYNPRIVVSHKVFPDRMNKRYFRHWHYVAGRDRAKVVRSSRFTLLGIESYLFRDFARAGATFAGALVRGQKDQVFASELQCILYGSVFRHKLFR